MRISSVRRDEKTTPGRPLAPAGAVVLALVAILMPLGALPVEAAFPGANGRIAFASTRSGGFDVYSMAANGSDVQRLTTAGGVLPAWSSDASRITFQSTRDGNLEIYVMNADGSGQTRLTTNAVFEEDPSFSPDGTKIAFTSARDDGSGEIYVMNADGTGVTRLTTSSGVDRDPVFSPDGAKIAFSSSRDDGFGEIYVMNADGSGQTRRTTRTTGFDAEPDWSPDGTKITFAAFAPSVTTSSAIFTMNADGSNVQLFVDTAGGDEGPVFSPDGAKIAFSSSAFGDTDVLTVNASDGSGQTNLTNLALIDKFPDWAPGTSPVTHTLSVAKAGTGAGSVSSSPVGIDCGSTCSADFASGTEVTLTPTPAAGSTFGGWSGACSGASACVVTMDQARSVTASFALAGPGGPPCAPTPGNAVVPASPPADLRLGELESDQCLFLFPEQEDVTIGATGLPVDSSPQIAGANPVLPAGSEVTSYLLHGDKVGATAAGVFLAGSYTFPEPVVGLIWRASKLTGSDSVVGIHQPAPPTSGLTYDASGGNRQLETTDTATVSGDGLTVQFDVQLNFGIDEVRVLTGATPADDPTWTVNTTDDANDGACTTAHCSLREAINRANGAAGTDTISFDIQAPLAAGAHTIQPTSALPTITEAVVIDGTTEPDFASCAAGPVVELDGQSAGASGASGLTINAGDSTVRGLAVNRFSQAGIHVLTGGGNLLVCNYVGTDVTGTNDRGNTNVGIHVQSSNNTIGGSSSADRNVVSGNNGPQIAIEGPSVGSTVQDNVIVGNHVGTNASGTAAIDSANPRLGIVLQDAFENRIGGTSAGERNLISGNNVGVRIANSLSHGNLVQGNLIGTAEDGTSPLGNNTGVDALFTSQTNMIGGTSAAAKNTIAFNLRDGVLVYPNASGLSILGNSVHSNLEQGVDLVASGFALSGDGVTANDVGDSDTGGNGLQNFPMLTSAVSNGGQTEISGSLASANGSYRVEFFSNPSCDSPGGNGEGRTYLGTTDVAVSGGSTAFTSTVSGEVAVGDVVTATATAPNGSTSEFSGCRQSLRPADLSLIKSGPTQALFGEQMTYTLTASNAGPQSVSSFTVTDTLPTGTSFVSAASSPQCSEQTPGTVTCTGGPLAAAASVQLIIAATAPSVAGSITNNAAITDVGTFDPDTGNNTASASTSVVAPKANLAVTKTGPATVTVSAAINYTVTVQNLGPQSATSFTVTDTLPGGVTNSRGLTAGCTAGTGTITCSGRNLAVGQSAAFSYTVTAPSSPGTITNRVVRTTSDPTDDVAGNDVSVVSTQVLALGINLGLTHSGAPSGVELGGTFVLIATVTNAGPATATNVRLTETLSGAGLPKGLRYVGGPSACGPLGASTVVCSLGPLVSGSSASVALTLKPWLTCDIMGTTGNDVNTINGSNNADVICGGGGNDTIDGNGGNDTIYGYGPTGHVVTAAGSVTAAEREDGPGNETVSTTTPIHGPGFPDKDNDKLSGGGGHDLIVGQNGSDTLHGNDGNDTISGGPTNDDLDGGAGADTLDGHGGIDTLSGGQGNDRLDGGGDIPSGDQVDNGGNTLNGGPGTDFCSRGPQTNPDTRKNCEN